MRKVPFRAIFLTLWLGALPLIYGCNREAASPPDPVAPDYSAEIAQHKERLDRLDVRVGVLEMDTASVDTESQAYDIAKTPFGAFTVAASAVTPFLDGYKVKLKIGNTTSARFKGAKLSVGWGVPLGSVPTREYVKARKWKDFDLVHEFPPGTFTDVEVAVTPAKAEEIKELTVGIKLNQLQLRK